MKKILIVLLLLAMSVMLFACGQTDNSCTNHTDADKDGKCDSCGVTVENNDDNNNANPNALTLISDGVVKFQIIYAKGLSEETLKTLTELSETFEALGASVVIAEESEENKKDCEILVGDVTTRGEKYAYDKYSLGNNGYVYKLIDGKIIINAGSEQMLSRAINKFTSDVLKIKSTTKELSDAAMSSENDVTVIQTDYKITSITVNGNDVKNYTIAIDTENEAHMEAAKALQDALYSRAGYYLNIVPLAEAGNSIIIENVADAGSKGFLVSTDNNTLRIQCAYYNKFNEAFESFKASEILLKTGELSFDTSYKYTYDISVVYYEDFGANGSDGVDDSAAMRAAHAFANECGQTVKAKWGAKYLIESITSIDEDGNEYYDPIVIKTNVDWSNAEIIIDDRYVPYESLENNHVFHIAGDYEVITLNLKENSDIINSMFPGGGIDRTTFTKIENWPYDFPAMIRLYNSGQRQYIRYGYNTQGNHQLEIVEVDAEGNVINDSGLLFDFEEVTHMEIYRTDETPVTIYGGTVTTRASQYIDTSGKYFHRGMSINRSHTTVKNVKHYVTDELDGINGNTGPAYSGFFVATTAVDIVIRDCILTARKYYKYAGTYDFTSSYVNGIYLINCIQSNYYILDESGNPTDVNSMENNVYWGVGGTNYCKNMVYDGCELTRYDAHCGLYNGKIINSKVTAINLIGGGEMLIENCDIDLVKNDTSVVDLRQDYGATWKGDITLRNCRVDNKRSDGLYIVKGSWVNHYFGYLCHIPNIIIDSLTLKNNTTVDIINLNADRNVHSDVLSSGAANLNPLVPPEYVKVINNYSKLYFRLSNVPFFVNTKTENVTKED